MTRQTTMAGGGKRRSGPRQARFSTSDGDGQRVALRRGDALGMSEVRPSGWRVSAAVSSQSRPTSLGMKPLSVRAQNVLKELAAELIGEQPPKGTWSPSRKLLLALTAERLATARNCGPHTSREIIDWAQRCGVTIKPCIRPGGSLSQMWAELTAHASAGALTGTEIVGALQRSIRRKSVRIPVAFQIVLVKILLSNFE